MSRGVWWLVDFGASGEHDEYTDWLVGMLDWSRTFMAFLILGLFGCFVWTRCPRSFSPLRRYFLPIRRKQFCRSACQGGPLDHKQDRNSGHVRQTTH